MTKRSGPKQQSNQHTLVTAFSIGDRWVDKSLGDPNPDTKNVYELRKMDGDRLGMDVYKAFKGETAGPINSWWFTQDQFKRMIETMPLVKTKSISATFDGVAEALESRGALDLAAQVDEIHALTVTQLRHVQEERLGDQISSLEDQIRNTDDPKELERLQDELESLCSERQAIVGPISPPDDVSPPNAVSDGDSSSAPNPLPTKVM